MYVCIIHYTYIQYIHPLGAPAAIGGDSPMICCCFVPLLPKERHNRVRATCELPMDKTNM